MSPIFDTSLSHHPLFFGIRYFYFANQNYTAVTGEHLLLRSHIEEISKLSEEEWEYISPHFQLRRLKKHHFLVQEGQMVDNEFWIVKGLVKSYAIDTKGKEHIMQFGMENYWVSDYAAYQFKREATMNVDCLEDSIFFSLSFENREKICRESPRMANFFRTKSNHGYISLQQRIMSLLTQTAEERYDEILKKLPHLIQRVPKRLLASYLGVSRETLSRL